MGIPYQHDDNIDLRDLEEVDLNNLTVNKLAMKAGDLELSEIRSEQDGTSGGALQFFTKVDGVPPLIEKLRINNVGALGIGGANYGDPLSFLQSNGGGFSVDWRKPVILGASLTTGSVTPPAPVAPFEGAVVVYNNVEYETVGCYDPATGIFTAPRSAYYMVNAYARVTDFDPVPFAARIQSFIYKKEVGGTFTKYCATDLLRVTDNFKAGTAGNNIIIYLNTDEEIVHRVAFNGNSTIDFRIRGDFFEKRGTYLSIHSLT
jgi:hypothetical protein